MTSAGDLKQKKDNSSPSPPSPTSGTSGSLPQPFWKLPAISLRCGLNCLQYFPKKNVKSKEMRLLNTHRKRLQPFSVRRACHVSFSIRKFQHNPGGGNLLHYLTQLSQPGFHRNLKTTYQKHSCTNNSISSFFLLYGDVHTDYLKILKLYSWG